MNGAQSLICDEWTNCLYVDLVLRLFGAAGDQDGNAVHDGVDAGAGGADQMRLAQAQSAQADGTG